jgi:hypothetical protein
MFDLAVADVGVTSSDRGHGRVRCREYRVDLSVVSND